MLITSLVNEAVSTPSLRVVEMMVMVGLKMDTTCHSPLVFSANADG
jgi:hypothetical protein